MTAIPVLYVLSGLPGVGKSTIARDLAQLSGAIWLRIDSIEKGIRDADLGLTDLKGAGYWAAQNVAADNLALNQSVIADCVNPFALTRDSWATVATKSGCRLCEIEVFCPNLSLHRSRVEARETSNDWPAVAARRFDPWDRDVLRLNSERLSSQQAAAKILASAETTVPVANPDTTDL